MKKLLVLSFFVFVFLLYGIYLSLYQFTTVQQEISLVNSSGYYDYRGITHVHSNASTGSGSYTEILSYAKKSKLDFIIFTEVNLPEKPDFIEGYYQDILVLAGGEYSYFDSRLMYYDAQSGEPPPGQSQTQVFFADTLSQKKRSQDGFVVLAHPYYARYSWRGDYPTGLNGIEVINLKSVLEKTWKESKIRTIFSLLIYPFNPNLSFLNIFSHPEDEILLWDQLNKKNKTVGFLGNDTTAKIPITNKKALKFPSYETSFNLVSNHILSQTELTGDFKKDKKKILRALKSGQSYMSLDLVGNPKGFFADISDGTKTYPIGSELVLKKNLKLTIQMPKVMRSPFKVEVFKDGESYLVSTSLTTSLNISAPGIYRVEVRVNPKVPIPRTSRWVPWIYTNNFYITE